MVPETKSVKSSASPMVQSLSTKKASSLALLFLADELPQQQQRQQQQRRRRKQHASTTVKTIHKQDSTSATTTVSTTTQKAEDTCVEDEYPTPFSNDIEEERNNRNENDEAKKAVANYKTTADNVLYILPIFVGFTIALVFGLGLGYGIGGKRGDENVGLPNNNSHDNMPVPTTSPTTDTWPNTMIPTMTPTTSNKVRPTRPPILERYKIFLQGGQTLLSNETIPLHSHHVYLKQEQNGNLVLYRNFTTSGRLFEIWSSNVVDSSSSIESSSNNNKTYFTLLQHDGHLMTLEGTPESPGKVIWKTNSRGNDGYTGYRLVLNNDDIGLEILQSGNPSPMKIWSSSDGVVAAPERPPQTPVILQSGPMVGHTTHDSTKIWFLAENKSSTVEVVYQKKVISQHDYPTTTLLHTDETTEPVMVSTTTPITVSMSPRNDEHDGTSLAEIYNLEASTTYIYQILVDHIPKGRGQFKTAPLPRRGVQFRYLLTSCMNVRSKAGYPEQPVWETILEATKPDFAMLNGDTIYLNDRDWDREGNVIYNRVWQRNLEQRQERYFANFISNVPTYMTWDDHDYGADNSYSHQRGKEKSLAVLKAFWANPSYGTPNITGVFYTYYWGNVHFMVMDDRWYRRKNWSQFGDEQLEWLYNQLLQSRAPFKIIVSGGTITTYNDLNWIGRFVTKHKIPGVLFNAGDTHKNEFLSKSFTSWPYNVTQITSSGIARENWMRPWAILHVDTVALDPTITVAFYGAENDYTFSEWTHDPTMTCTDLGEIAEDNVPGRNNHTRCSQTIRLSDLVPKDVSDVILESPMGGDELVVGSQWIIMWRTFGTNVETVMLQYSVNAGLSWKNITDDDWIVNTGTHTWTVPPEPSVRVKVRVVAHKKIDVKAPNDAAWYYTSNETLFHTNPENYTSVESQNKNLHHTNNTSDNNTMSNENLHTMPTNGKYTNTEKYTISENYGLLSIKMQHEVDAAGFEEWI